MSYLAVFFCFVFQKKRQLSCGKEPDQRNDGEDLEFHPLSGRKRAPYDFIEDRQPKEKKPPSICEFPPTLFRKIECRSEDVLDEQAPKRQPTEQSEAEECIKHRRLHFDESVVLEIQR